MSVQEFLDSPEEISKRKGPEDRIIMSSRVRLARNLKGHCFPTRAAKAEKQQILDEIRQAAAGLPQLKGALFDSMDNLTVQDKQLLVERHLISREHAARKDGSGVALRKDESVCMMINEEDHIRMQAILPGLQIQKTWEIIDGLDTALSEHLQYAFSPDLGYLTSCPTNLGTAIRVSAMLHLPGLVLADQIQPTVEAVTKLGMAVRGFYGEGTDALGNIFQVSNQRTLGERETDIVERLNKVLLQLIENETNARAVLVEKKPKVIYNHIGRAYGALAYSHIIASKETMNLLSILRLGVELGFFPGADVALINELFLTTQPSHLQQASDHKLSADERDVLRATLLRDRLKGLPQPKMP